MNAVIDTEATPQLRVAPHPTHKFKLLLRREFWEHKGGFLWAPLVAGGISLVLTLMALVVAEVAARRATSHGDLVFGDADGVVVLPADLQEIVTRYINAVAMLQRDDVRKLNDGLVADLKGKGMQFNTTDAELFRAKLRSAGFYAEWHKKFGDEAWALLEKYTGKLI